MGKPLDLAGRRFGLLVAVEWTGRRASGGRIWRCTCECGNYTEVPVGALTSGDTTSCGCRHRTELAARNRTHGMTKTPEYDVWAAMIARCHRPGATFYELYGGRGISVCDAWRGSFETFIADMGERPSAAHEIDRKDNDGNYEPGNCRWATRTEQARNTSRNRVLTHNGQAMTLVEWGEKTGLAAEAIRARIDRLGWSVEKALTTPARRLSRKECVQT